VQRLLVPCGGCFDAPYSRDSPRRTVSKRLANGPLDSANAADAPSRYQFTNRSGIIHPPFKNHRGLQREESCCSESWPRSSARMRAPPGS
jgi:hypothetical protein